MILVGEAYGTEDPLFKDLFVNKKAYLLGKVLTVESRIKKINQKSAPLAASKFYNVNQGYENLLLNFV
jgi:hypothetical protein